MHRSCTHRFSIGALLVLGALACSATAFAQPMLPPEICSIVSRPSSPVAGDDVTLCGPEGDGYTYTWQGPGVPADTHTRCVTLHDVAAGTYDLEFTISHGDSFRKCDYRLVVGDHPADLVCPDVPKVCSADVFQLCGQEGDGLTYTWSGDGIDGDVHTRCVSVGPLSAGTHTIHYVVSHGEQFRKCDLQIVVSECFVNCPRTVGFWGAQCEQRGNGSAKFSPAQVGQIAGWIDDHADGFDWSDDMAGFCAIINPSHPMTIVKQAKRQLAGLLANVATGELGLIASNGNEITLSLDTPISCGALNVNTIGQFIDRADSLLGALDGQSLDDADVYAWYSAISSCADEFNNGNGVGPVCSDEDDDEDARAAQTGRLASDKGSVRVSPNPSRDGTRLEYATRSDAKVTLGVYDLAGRQVRSLVNGFQPAGDYSVRWDGRDASGARVKPGVYFVRGSIGSTAIGSRVLVLQ